MGKINIPNSEYTAIVKPNGHIIVFLKGFYVGHIQTVEFPTVEQVIEMVEKCFIKGSIKKIKLQFDRGNLT